MLLIRLTVLAIITVDKLQLNLDLIINNISLWAITLLNDRLDLYCPISVFSVLMPFLRRGTRRAGIAEPLRLNKFGYWFKLDSIHFRTFLFETGSQTCEIELTFHKIEKNRRSSKSPTCCNRYSRHLDPKRPKIDRVELKPKASFSDLSI